jgi:hypothetical protein
MPGGGIVEERDYTSAECAALEAEGGALGMSGERVFELLGARTLDVHLNGNVMWTNVPAKVWGYTLERFAETLNRGFPGI